MAAPMWFRQNIVPWVRANARLIVVSFVVAATLSAEATDSTERALDTAIIENIKDFGRLYRVNVIIQCVAIVSGILATILASLTNTNNARCSLFICHPWKWQAMFVISQ